MGTPRLVAKAFRSASLREATRLDVAAMTVKSLEAMATGRPAMVASPATFESAGGGAPPPRPPPPVERAELHEGADVGEVRDALAGVEPSLRAASSETLRPAHAPGVHAARLEILHPIVPAHEGSAKLSRGRRDVKDGPAPWLRSTP